MTTPRNFADTAGTCQAFFEKEFNSCVIVIAMRMIDAIHNQRAAAAVRWSRSFLGERNRNAVKKITQTEFVALLRPLMGEDTPHFTMVSRYESGNSIVPTDLLFAIAQLVSNRLGRVVSVDDLLDLAERGFRLSYVHGIAA